MKLNNRWTYAGAIAIACGTALGIAVFSPNTYEFPSCEPGSKVINVMRVPYGYQSSTASTLIRDDQPIGWTEKEAKGPAVFVRNGGLLLTIMYASYPEYQPLGSKSWRKYSTMERESGDPNKLLFATMEFGRGRGLDPSNWSFIHDPNGTRKYSLQRIREDSIDGKYWAYPQPEQRAKFPYGKVRYNPNEPTYFMPKDMGFHVLIGCTDTGVNAFPKDGQCFIRSDWGDDPNLGCRSVEYRIAAKDMSNWREFDVRVKQQIKSFISQRTHGYNEALSKKEK